MRLANRFDRVAVLVAGLAMGVAASVVAPGCILADHCIVITTPGTDWCLGMEDATMWPIGQPQLAEPVSPPGGGELYGCRCFNDADVAILVDELPPDIYAGLVGEIEASVRNKCALAVPPGYDHNCYTQGSLAPVFAGPYIGDPSDACIGSCSYIKPPPFGSCGDDPDPYECNEEYGGDAGTDDSTGTDTGDVNRDEVIPGATEVLR